MAGEKGKGKKVGRNKAKCEKYKLLHRRERNKLKRILQSNGNTFAKEWAMTRNVSGIMLEIRAKRRVKPQKKT